MLSYFNYFHRNASADGRTFDHFLACTSPYCARLLTGAIPLCALFDSSTNFLRLSCPHHRRRQISPTDRLKLVG